VLSILSDGRLGPATDVKIPTGKIGPTKATNAPPSSFAISGHDRTHAHMIQADPAVALKKIAVDRGDTPNHFEQLDQLQAVRKIFLELSSTDEVRVIDGNQSIEAVYAAIVEVLVQGVLKKKRCAKDYDCDYFFCAPRQPGNCQWAQLAPALQGTARRPTALIK
jgi:hypothetical protein